MKVIKRVEACEWSAKVTCDNCTSVLEVETKDLRFDSDQRENSSWYTYKCPVCNTHNQLAGDFVPQKYRRGVR